MDMDGEVKVIRGIRYLRDSIGWIWREVPNARPGEPHWLRTGFSSFQMVEALR